MKLLRWSVALSLAGMVGVVSAEGESNPTLARNLAATCANCHGTDGRAQAGPGMEALAGGDADPGHVQRDDPPRTLRSRPGS